MPLGDSRWTPQRGVEGGAKLIWGSAKALEGEEEGVRGGGRSRSHLAGVTASKGMSKGERRGGNRVWEFAGSSGECCGGGVCPLEGPVPVGAAVALRFGTAVATGGDVLQWHQKKLREF